MKLIYRVVYLLYCLCALGYALSKWGTVPSLLVGSAVFTALIPLVDVIKHRFFTVASSDDERASVETMLIGLGVVGVILSTDAQYTLTDSTFLVVLGFVLYQRWSLVVPTFLPAARRGTDTSKWGLPSGRYVLLLGPSNPYDWPVIRRLDHDVYVLMSNGRNWPGFAALSTKQYHTLCQQLGLSEVHSGMYLSMTIDQQNTLSDIDWREHLRTRF